jgi:hypothetical protein
VQLLDGLVTLPAAARTVEAFEWLADEVVDANGEASVWIGRPTSAGQERRLEMRMAETAAKEYLEVLVAAQDAIADDSGSRRRTLSRLRRELSSISGRDHFPPAERERARRAVERLAALVDVEV